MLEPMDGTVNGDVHDALSCRGNQADSAGCAHRAETRGSRPLNHASVDDGRACRIEGLFNINHGLTDSYLEHLDLKLRALMLLHRGSR
ncbi:hypothetical protein ACVWWI_006782 [Bradyrhizobium sp. USDA 3686]|nr:hypothetical protein [Bradyrhizobium canariense]